MWLASCCYHCYCMVFSDWESRRAEKCTWGSSRDTSRKKNVPGSRHNASRAPRLFYLLASSPAASVVQISRLSCCRCCHRYYVPNKPKINNSVVIKKKVRKKKKKNIPEVRDLSRLKPCTSVTAKNIFESGTSRVSSHICSKLFLITKKKGGKQLLGLFL